MPFNHLHVAIFDSIVDHLDEMSGSGFTNPVAARVAIVNFGADTLEDRSNVRPSLRVTTRHQRGSTPGSLFSTGNARPDIKNSFLVQILAPPDGILSKERQIFENLLVLEKIEVALFYPS